MFKNKLLAFLIILSVVLGLSACEHPTETTKTATPTVAPTVEPTVVPTMQPTVTPTVVPTVEPTVQPTVIPTVAPTVVPTPTPTVAPTKPTETLDCLTFNLLSDGTYEVSSCDKGTDIKEIYIPLTYNGIPVTQIGEGAFDECKNIVHVYLTENITTINTSAFSRCDSLEWVYPTDSLTYVGPGNFDKDNFKFLVENGLCYYGTESNPYKFLIRAKDTLDEVFVNNSTRFIAGSAFSSNDKMISIQLGKNIEFIGSYAFYNCQYLSKITMFENVKKIEKDAFKDSSIYQIYYMGEILDWCNIEFGGAIDDSYYVYMAFTDWEIVKQIEIPDSITSINKYQFYGWAGLEAVTMSDDVRYIDEYAFAMCKKLVSCQLSKNLDSIKMHAFRECALESIYLPDGFTRLEDTALILCMDLVDIRVPDSILYFGEDNLNSRNYNTYTDGNGNYYLGNEQNHYVIFESSERNIENKNNYSDNIVIPEGVKIVLSYAFGKARQYGYFGYIGDLTLPSTLLYIGDGAFSSCQIENVYINSNLEYIGYKAFESSTVKKVIFNGYSSVDEVMIEAFKGCGNLNEFDFTKINNKIFDRAFEGCKEIKVFETNDTLTDIGNNAFSSISLREVYLNSDKLNIGKEVLSFESKETSKLYFNKMPLSVDESFKYTHLNIYVNSDIYSYLELKMGNLNPLCDYIEVYFKEDTQYVKLKEILIDKEIDIYDYSFRGFNELEKIEITTKVNSIGNFILEGCYNIKEIIIPDMDKPLYDYIGMLQSVTLTLTNTEVIKEGAFEDANYLKEIKFSKNLKEIKDNAFAYCMELQKIELNEGLTRIGASAFMGTYALLGNLVLPSTLQHIGAYAFAFSNANIVLGNNIKTIDRYAFTGCNNIETMVLPNSVITLGEFTFENCINLKSVTLSSSMTKIEEGTFMGCSALNEIIIPSSINHIIQYAFGMCIAMKELYLPTHISVIENKAFYGCSNLIINVEAVAKPSTWETGWDSDVKMVFYGM